MPLFWISLAFLCGIVLAHNLAIPLYGWCGLAAIGTILTIPTIFRRLFNRVSQRFMGILIALRMPSPALLPAMLLCLSMGAIRFQLGQPSFSPGFIANYNDQATPVIVQGIVNEPPDVRDTYVNLRVQVEQIQATGQNQFAPVSGLLLARLPSGVTFNYGDRLQLQGKLQTPPENEDFSYRDYLANQGIYSYLPYPSASLVESGRGNPLMAALYSFRQKAVDLVYSYLPDPEAGLLAGILLGAQAGIPAGLQEAFRQTGTSHIIVISGFNITIIAGMFTLVFGRLLGRYKGAIVSAVGIILYTLLVGANAAVVRAAILGLLTLLGHLIGRRQAGLNSLTFVAGVMAILTPTVLWDVSFQLSFAATLGIMLYAEPLTEWFINRISRLIPPEKAQKLAGPMGEYFLLTLAAQLTTLPLMIYYFKRLSLTAMVANPIILPAQPAVEIIGGLAVLTGMVFKPLGQLLAWAAWPFTAYTIHMVEWLATIPHGSIALGQVAGLTITLFYVVLLALSFARTQVKNLTSHFAPAIPLGLLSVVVVLLWRAASTAPDGQMRITILDVGTGEGVLLQSPTGRNVLINGGASTNKLSEALGRRLPIFDWSLDWLVVADIDDEDVAGLAGNLERFRPGSVLWAGNTGGSRAAGDLWSQIGSLSIPIMMAQPGQALDLGGGARLSVVTASDKGAVLWLEWQNFRMLLPEGMDTGALETLKQSTAMRNISAFLLAESGYAPVNPPGMIAQLRLQIAALSVATADKKGLPSPETIQALERYNLLRTDQNGWIEITTDGKQMWVEVERK